MNKKEYEINMNYIANMYKNSKKEIENRNKSDRKKSYMLDKDVEFLNYIDIMLSLIPFELERIIRNDFLDNRTVKWWQEFYSKSTYYRRKHEAVKTFIDCLSL